MKLRDLLNVCESDEFVVAVGEDIKIIRLYMGETLEPYLDMEVLRVRAYEGGFDIDLAA